MRSKGLWKKKEFCRCVQSNDDSFPSQLLLQQTIRAQLRANVFRVISTGGDYNLKHGNVNNFASTVEGEHEKMIYCRRKLIICCNSGQISLQLVADLLKSLNLTHSLSVFRAECGPSVNLDGRHDAIAHTLKLKPNTSAQCMLSVLVSSAQYGDYTNRDESKESQHSAGRNSGHHKTAAATEESDSFADVPVATGGRGTETKEDSAARRGEQQHGMPAPLLNNIKSFDFNEVVEAEEDSNNSTSGGSQQQAASAMAKAKEEDEVEEEVAEYESDDEGRFVKERRTGTASEAKQSEGKDRDDGDLSMGNSHEDWKSDVIDKIHSSSSSNNNKQHSHHHHESKQHSPHEEHHHNNASSSRGGKHASPPKKAGVAATAAAADHNEVSMDISSSFEAEETTPVAAAPAEHPSVATAKKNSATTATAAPAGSSASRKELLPPVVGGGRAGAALPPVLGPIVSRSQNDSKQQQQSQAPAVKQAHVVTAKSTADDEVPSEEVEGEGPEVSDEGSQPSPSAGDKGVVGIGKSSGGITYAAGVIKRIEPITSSTSTKRVDVKSTHPSDSKGEEDDVVVPAAGVNALINKARVNRMAGGSTSRSRTGWGTAVREHHHDADFESSFDNDNKHSGAVIGGKPSGGSSGGGHQQQQHDSDLRDLSDDDNGNIDASSGSGYGRRGAPPVATMNNRPTSNRNSAWDSAPGSKTALPPGSSSRGRGNNENASSGGSGGGSGGGRQQQQPQPLEHSFETDDAPQAHGGGEDEESSSSGGDKAERDALAHSYRSNQDGEEEEDRRDASDEIVIEHSDDDEEKEEDNDYLRSETAAKSHQFAFTKRGTTAPPMTAAQHQPSPPKSGSSSHHQHHHPTSSGGKGAAAAAAAVHNSSEEDGSGDGNDYAEDFDSDAAEEVAPSPAKKPTVQSSASRFGASSSSGGGIANKPQAQQQQQQQQQPRNNHYEEDEEIDEVEEEDMSVGQVRQLSCAY